MINILCNIAWNFLEISDAAYNFHSIFLLKVIHADIKKYDLIDLDKKIVFKVLTYILRNLIYFLRFLEAKDFKKNEPKVDILAIQNLPSK